MWDPVNRVFFASTVPRGTRNEELITNRKNDKMAPWFKAAPYSSDPELAPLLHAEDNIIATWLEDHSEALNDDNKCKSIFGRHSHF